MSTAEGVGEGHSPRRGWAQQRCGTGKAEGFCGPVELCVLLGQERLAGSWDSSPEPGVSLTQCVLGFGSLGWAAWAWLGLSWTECPAWSLGCSHLKFGGRAGAWAGGLWEVRDPACSAGCPGQLLMLPHSCLTRRPLRPCRPGATGAQPLSRAEEWSTHHTCLA